MINTPHFYHIPDEQAYHEDPRTQGNITNIARTLVHNGQDKSSHHRS